MNFTRLPPRLLVAAVIAGLAGLVAGAAAAPVVRVDGSRFVDPHGRELILHGLNIVDKSPTWTDYPWVDEGTYAQLQQWGFNCVRLGFTWASLEPEPGRYRPESIEALRRRVEWAGRHGLYVILDLHQDLYGQRFSDGAPDWATLTDGQPHAADGKVWSDAYVTSRAVQTAMDNFYANRPGPGGVGLQDRYAAAWREVARHFAGNPTVVGYDLMNEPFAGSLVPRGLQLHLQQFARETGRATEAGAAEVAAQWADPAGRTRILGQLEDPALYGRVMDAAEGLYQQFERERLNPFFQRVTAAIREVDRDHVIFLETNGAGNMGVRTAVERVRGADGSPDPQQAYAPHAYDLVTDTPDVALASHRRLDLILRRHEAAAVRLGLPMILGEWGAYYGNSAVLASANFHCRQFERLKCGDTFWALEPDLAKQVVLQAIRRPYPLEVAGRLDRYAADPAAHRFECEWHADPAAGPTRIYLPADYLAGAQVVVEPGTLRHQLVAVPGDGGACYLMVTGGRAGDACRVVVAPAARAPTVPTP